MHFRSRVFMFVGSFGLLASLGTAVIATQLVPDVQAKIRKKDKPAEPEPSAPDGGRTPAETEEENKGRTIKVCNPACTGGTYCDSHTGTCKN